MGLISKVFGFGSLARDIGTAVRENTEVFHVNETEEMHANAQKFQSALGQYQAEFVNAPSGIFGQIVDGLNRLPRPFMALGTVGLFIFALYDPVRFSLRMQGLQEVPDPLWWLMGAIVSFYFGARELHYFRTHKKLNVTPLPPKVQKEHQQFQNPDPIQHARPERPQTSDNPAIADWIKGLEK